MKRFLGALLTVLILTFPAFGQEGYVHRPALVPGTDYLTPTGSAAGLTNFPTLNQSTSGTAAGLSGTPAIGVSGVTDSSLTASLPVFTDANKLLVSKSVADTLTALGAFSVTGIQSFAVTGTYTPTAGTKYALAFATAAGGAGGAGGSGGTSASGGSGGAGETRFGAFSAATIGASQEVTIGGAGADTSLGALLVAKPGVAGGNATTTTPANGGVPGSGGSGGIGFSGGGGAPGNWGGSANQFGNPGGASFWGGGGKGGDQGAVGSAGAAYGSGGGSGGGASGSAGGDGAGGFVLVIEFK